MKKILVFASIFSLFFICEKSFAQTNWIHWQNHERIFIYYSFVPAKGSNYAYYKLKFINMSYDHKSVSYDVYFESNGKQSAADRKSFRIENGEVIYSIPFYIDTNVKLWFERAGGGSIPKIGMKNLVVKKS